MTRRHVSIRIYLGVLFGICMLVVGLTIAGLFYTRMRSAIISNSSEVFAETAQLLTQQIALSRSQIDISLKVAARTDLATATTLEARLKDLPVFGAVLQAVPIAEAVYVGYQNGDFFMLRRYSTVSDAKAPKSSAFVVQSAAPDKTSRFFYYDAALRQLGARDVPSYRLDPRSRPWFDAPVGHLNITAPYVFFTTHELGLTLSTRAPSGSVFGADVVIESLSDLLAQLRPTPSTVAAIVEDGATVVAYSDPKTLHTIDGDTSAPVTLAGLHSPPLLAAFANALPSGMHAEGSYRDKEGRIWHYEASPLPGRTGSSRTLLLAIPDDELVAAAYQVRRDALLAELGVLIAVIPLTFWLSRFVTNPLARLSGEASALRNLDFTERDAPRSNITEIAEFSDTFAAMRRHIRDYNSASTRFVPHEFLEQLGRKDIQALQLGDHAERTMTVLFSDIRSFTTLSGGMTPEQTFKFVNSYLTRIGPIIREHRGFIDKYIGDAIMALFPETPANALDAGIAMQRRVVTYNQERARAGYPPVAIGIGIHRGDLMMGTIGESQRFETTVIADAVNIASRLESLTKTFHALILASGDVVEGVDKGKCCARRLCDVQVKGATHPVTIYEICDADPPDLMMHKVRTMDDFSAGRIAYAGGHFVDAYRAFDQIAEAEPRDLPATYFRDRAWELSRAQDLHWDGIERMETK